MSDPTTPEAEIKADGWENSFTGLGTTRDKLTAWRYERDTQIEAQQASDVYHGDDLVQKIVDSLPSEALKNGYELMIDGDPDLTKAVRTFAEDKLQLSENLFAGLSQGRMTGGAILWVSSNDGGRLDQPLNENGIRETMFLEVFDRLSVSIAARYDDPTKPKFGQPSLYRISDVGRQTFELHESRVILCGGAYTSRREKWINAGWDHPVIKQPWAALVSYQSNEKSVSHLMTDIAQGVLKMDDLLKMVSNKQWEAIRARMVLFDMSRSVARCAVIDGKESFERVSTPLTGVPDIIDRSMQRLAAAAKMPVTILFGRSPAGMNATGESDMTQWYDSVQKYQESQVLGKLRRLFTLMMLDRSGPTAGKIPKDWSVSLPPLWQESAQEQADTRLKIAQADQIYLSTGVLFPEEIAMSRFGGEAWSMETQIVSEAREEALKLLETSSEDETPDTEGTISLTPSSQAAIVTVNEGRASIGKGPLEGSDGSLTIAEFLAKHSETVAAANAAESGTDVHSGSDQNGDPKAPPVGSKGASGMGAAGGDEVRTADPSNDPGGGSPPPLPGDDNNAE